ncbi:MAG: hypothetical protein RBS80_17950 [Thermoguttaceae bacterium]|jgi:hypothetical protein|nr:hypothetical protein [Thermoguttaceae bacterium]
MKKLLILTAVVLLASSTVGCRCGRWLWRGPAQETSVITCPSECPPNAVISDPCCAPPATMMPGPATYAPAPQ